MMRRGGWWTSVLGIVLMGLLGLVSGCANLSQGAAPTNTPAPRTVVAQPSAYQGIYVQTSTTVTQAPADGSNAIGYDTLSDGTKVEVVPYVHTYPEPLDSFPRVYWSGRWYYNVNGDFVYWSNYYGCWCYYWGPPAPLVSYWNAYYPWAPYYWGVGYYGAGWYWGGVGYYGYHAYGMPVTNQYQHHHHMYAQNHGGGQGNPGGPTAGPPVKGGPAGGRPNPGGPAGSRPPMRTLPGAPPTRTPPGASGQPPTRTAPTAAPQGPAVANRTGPPTRTSPAGGAPIRTASAAPQRTAPIRGAVVTRSQPGHTPQGLAVPTRTAPTRTRPVRSYTTPGGQQVTVIDPHGPQRTAVTTRVPQTIGRLPAANVRPPVRSNTPVRPPMPAWGSRPAAPTRAAPVRSAPTRVATPSRMPSWGPTHVGRATAPPPQRSFFPSHSAPMRTGPGPSYRAPAFSPGPSHHSAPPMRMAPAHHSAPPMRTAPMHHSAPMRTAPMHHGHR